MVFIKDGVKEPLPYYGYRLIMRCIYEKLVIG